MSEEVEKKVEDFFTKFPKHTYQKNQILTLGGDEPKGIFYLIRGRIREYDISAKGDEVVVNVFKPQAFFPMSWAINKTPNQYFFKAEIISEVNIVPADVALDFVKTNPDILLDLLGRLYIGIEGLLGRMVYLMGNSADNRLAYELVIEARRFGKADEKGVIALNINEGDLASRAGLTRETISREVHKLKDLGLLRVDHQKLLITDLAALERILTNSL